MRHGPVGMMLAAGAARKAQKPLQIHLAYFTYGGAIGQSAGSMLHLCSYLGQENEPSVAIYEGAMIDILRTRAAFNAVASKADVLLMVDRDMSWDQKWNPEVEAACRRAVEKGSLVGVFASRRAVGRGGNVMWHDTEDVSKQVRIGQRDFIPCASVGTGMMAVSTKTLVTMADKLMQAEEPYAVRPTYTWDETLVPHWFRTYSYELPDKKWRHVGEDVAFCRRARHAGFEVEVATGVVLMHHGDFAYAPQHAFLPAPPK